MMNVVLLPGFLCDERLWGHQIDFLKDKFPLTPVNFTHCKDLEEMIQVVNEASGERAHIVGFSMGGYIAQEFLARYPEKVATLFLLASAVGTLPEEEKKSRLEVESSLRKSHYKGMSEKIITKFIHPDSLKKPEIPKLIHDMSATNTSETYINQMKATIDRREFVEELNAFSGKIMIAGGEDDRVIRKTELESFHSQIPKSQFKLFPQCGHYVPLEQPDLLNQLLLDFLS